MCCSTNSINKYSIEPVQCSDFTVHYQDTSFHLHQFVLIKLSGFFEAILNDKTIEICSQSDHCSQSNHRCIALGSDIGGISITPKDLYRFFLGMYEHFACGNEYSDLIEDLAQQEDFPGYSFFAVIENTILDEDEITVSSYEFDKIRTRSARGTVGKSKRNSHCKKGTHIGLTWWCTDEHPNYHLADYFQCDSMMYKYRKQALYMVRMSTGICQALWRFLLLTDRFYWPDVRTACLKTIKRFELMQEPGWTKILILFKPNTVKEIINAGITITEHGDLPVES